MVPTAELSWSDRLVDRWIDLRNRLLSSPRFVRFATRFPLTRPVARRRARRLFDLCAGFVYSQILLACVRLRVLERLAESPRTAAALSDELSLPPDATARLLDAAVALGLVERRAGARFGLGALGAALLANPGVAAMVEHHTLLYTDLADPVALLRAGRSSTSLGGYWAYARDAKPSAVSDEQVAAYSALMSSTLSLVADQVLDAYPLGRHRCLLDVGGGEGTFIAAAAARTPALRCLLFDLPPVAARAEARFAERGLADRAQAIGGDFHTDPLPRGADVVSLIRVVHDHDDDEALALLRAVRGVLPDDGVLLLAEPMSQTSGAEPIGDAYFGFYLMAMGSGRPRTSDELEGLLRAAGFEDLRLVPTLMPLQARLIIARPSASVSRGSASTNHGV